MAPEQPAAERYSQYIRDVTAEISACVQTSACQPILFIGSGLSKRYFGGPSWDELLSVLAKPCPLIDKDYPYYKQSLGSLLAVGEEFARRYQEWAWSKGKSQFPAELFSDKIAPGVYIKYKIAEYLRSLTPKSLTPVSDPSLKKELEALRKIRPHAIITTNYDQFIELLFPDYQPVVGQQIIRGGAFSVGEIFKIHGCVSVPDTLVFTQTDYADFVKRKKYLSAKLLTYFSEHPLLFLGYSASDPNIRGILSDIDEALPVTGGVISNVFLAEWRKDISPAEYPAREKLIAIEGSRSVRINGIETSDFRWIFDALGSQQALEGVSPKVLRSLLSRSYHLVRHDIPRMTFQANFEFLEHATADQEQFAKLFGITTISDPSVVAANYPYTLSAVARKLGFNYWYAVQVLIDKVKQDKEIDIKSSDNRYHIATKYGKSILHKYSDAAIDLLKKVKKGEAYNLTK
jgi:hypothetical protein